MELSKTTQLVLSYFFVFISGCNVFNSGDSNKMVPDNTPFIASTLEVTADTVHHYPEVYVGTVKFKDGYYDDRLCCQSIPGIWWPPLNAQVNKMARSMDLIRTDVDEAKVSITGPLDTEMEQTVRFKSEGLGVYGDRDYELELIEHGRYRLDVTMPDGTHYRSVTTLLELPVWPVPDTLRPQLELLNFGDSSFAEQTIDRERIKLNFKESSDAEMTVIKINQSDDKDVLELEENGEFLYEDRGNFLRDGGFYGIRHNEKSILADENHTGPLWFEQSFNPLKTQLDIWMYVRQLNSDMSNPWVFQPEFIYIAADDEGFWAKQDQEFVDAKLAGDTNYLFEISNILKVGENGEVLPKEQSDAIGVFGGFSTAYRKTVMKPRRSWDPDSLGWGPEK